ncbi:ABC transporter, multidrug efflux family [Prochlorococcus marinus str. NATL1A]|uniref:ABC transporter, multidrug efflux family n=1 Tax=Prochlorococcus marinus (strain NATL1A) TaxID=167555 RepID=A2C1X3_PROM1|nr:ABC transporter ATP-binding protein [Prochlorococcus marinus]ABM75483.1 ABC transporter, multidrug efflux family [Prochlorococcus marinus str. NATL1A]
MAALRLDLIKNYLRPHKRELIIGALCLIFVNILSVAIPMEVRNIVDDLKEGFTFSYVLNKSTWLILMATVMGGARLISRQLVFGVGRQVEVSLRQKLFDRMLEQDPGWVQTIGTGEVITRATSDLENIRRLLGFTVLSLTNTLLAYTFTLPAMLTINPLLTFFAISVYPVLLGTVGLFGGRMVKQRKRQQQALSELSELIQEDLSGISAIKIYGQERAEQEAFKKLNIRYRDAAINLARTASTLFPLLQGLSSISLLLLIAIGSGQLSSGTLTVGGLVALILYVERLVFPTALLGFTLNTFQLGQVSLERVEELLNHEPTIKDKDNTVNITKPISGKLEARNLSVSYEDSPRKILDEISFKINPGEIVALVGPVGCGKTTLARALGRMIKIDEGSLYLDDNDVMDLKLKQLRSNIALVPQEGYLFTETLSENIKYGNPEASIEKVQESAYEARMTDDIKGFPDGLKTLVGERGITLSGGQRQRTALSRALLVDSKIIVLDDALASVDNKTASAILQTIKKQYSKTVLMISHQLSAAAACDRILVMNDGKIVQEGTHQFLIKKDGLYKSMWEREKAKEQIQSDD